MNTHMKKSNKMLDYFNYFETSIKQMFCRLFSICPYRVTLAIKYLT